MYSMNPTRRHAGLSPRERVLTALRREVPDQVPWIEGIVGNGIASAVCRAPIAVDWSVAPDGFPKQPGAQLAEEQKKVNRVLGKDYLQFSAFAPVFCHTMTKATDDMKPENVRAMADAVREFGVCVWASARCRRDDVHGTRWRSGRHPTFRGVACGRARASNGCLAGRDQVRDKGWSPRPALSTREQRP